MLGESKLYNLILLLVAVGLVYDELCYVFGIEEIRNMVDKMKMRLKRDRAEALSFLLSYRQFVGKHSRVYHN